MSRSTFPLGIRDPFLAALTTALISCGALALAVINDWLGPDVGEGSAFCEALRTDIINQPTNTWSNLGFVLAGLVIGWRGHRRPEAMNGLVGLFACVVVFLGPASAAMHASGTEIGQALDLTSMFLISSFAASYALKRWRDLSSPVFISLFIALLIMSELGFFFGGEVPVVLHAGNAIFAILILVALVLEVLLWRRHRDRSVALAGLGAFASLALAFIVWNFDQGVWCEPHSLIQGHGFWHLLCALSAYFLYLVYEREPAQN